MNSIDTRIAQLRDHERKQRAQAAHCRQRIADYVSNVFTKLVVDDDIPARLRLGETELWDDGDRYEARLCFTYQVQHPERQHHADLVFEVSGALDAIDATYDKSQEQIEGPHGFTMSFAVVRRRQERVGTSRAVDALVAWDDFEDDDMVRSPFFNRYSRAESEHPQMSVYGRRVPVDQLRDWLLGAIAEEAYKSAFGHAS